MKEKVENKVLIQLFGAGLIGMPPGMMYGPPMAFPGGPMLAPMMQPRFRWSPGEFLLLYHPQVWFLKSN